MVHVRKSELDFRSYRFVELENGMNVLIISSCDYEPRRKKVALAGDGIPGDLVADVGPVIQESVLETIAALAETELNPASCFSKDNKPRECGGGGDWFPELTEKQKIEACRRTQNDDDMVYVALTVGVGYFDDPKEYPGMAHLLEHLLLMGCPEYPDSAYFDNFLELSGGSPWNGNTEGCRTVYYYDTSLEYLEESLHLLMLHLKYPLLNLEDIVKERENVDAEFRKAVPQHQFRFNHLLHMLASKSHPYFKFAWGNSKSLGGRDNYLSKCRLALRKFHETYYVPQAMFLAVQAPETPDRLEKLVRSVFCNLPPRGGRYCVRSVDLKEFPQPFCNKKFTRMYKVLTRTNTLRLSVTWQLPREMWRKYTVKPLEYLNYILLNEFKYGLPYYLKENGLITEVTGNPTETSFERSDACTLYSLHFELTQKGLREYIKVVAALFSYIKLLRREGPQPGIFLEISKLKATEFHYIRESDQGIKVKELSEAMRIYKAQDIISGPVVMSCYDAELIGRTVECLTPDGVNLMLFSKSFKKIAKKEEKYFGIRYCSRALSKEEMGEIENVWIYSNFAICGRNPFVTTNFRLVPPFCPTDVTTTLPIKLEDGCSDIWFLQDDGMINPQAAYTIGILSPIVNISCKNAVMMDLFVEMLLHELCGAIYFATMAMLELDVQRHLKGLRLRLCGFSEKLTKLLSVVVSKICKIGNGTTNADIDRAVNRVQGNYERFLEEPCQLASDLRKAVLFQEFHKVCDRLALLKSCSIGMEDLNEFTRVFKSEMLIRGFIAGNVNRNTVVEIQSVLRNLKPFKPIVPGMFPKNRVCLMPCGEKCLRVQSFSLDGDVTLVKNIYQITGKSITAKIICEYLTSVMSEPLFHALRTEKQLSYSPEVLYHNDFGVITFQIHLISPADKYKSCYIDEAVDEFLQTFYEGNIFTLTNEDFQEIQSSFVDGIQARICITAEQEGEWENLATEDFDFEYLEKELMAWRDLKLEDVISFYTKYLLSPSYLEKSENCMQLSEFRKISIQVVGLNIKERVKCGRRKQKCDVNYSLRYLTENERPDYFIENISEFKSTLCTFPPKF